MEVVTVVVAVAVLVEGAVSVVVVLVVVGVVAGDVVSPVAFVEDWLSVKGASFGDNVPPPLSSVVDTWRK